MISVLFLIYTRVCILVCARAYILKGRVKCLLAKTARGVVGKKVKSTTEPQE